MVVLQYMYQSCKVVVYYAVNTAHVHTVQVRLLLNFTTLQLRLSEV